MMATVRRLLGLSTDITAAEAAQERSRRYEEIAKGLHEAAQRVHYLEVEADLRAKGIFFAQHPPRESGNKS